MQRKRHSYVIFPLAVDGDLRAFATSVLLGRIVGLSVTEHLIGKEDLQRRNQV